MSYNLAKQIHEQRKAKCLANAMRANVTLEEAQAIYNRYQKLWFDTKEEKYLRLLNWAASVITGVRLLNGEKLWL